MTDFVRALAAADIPAAMGIKDAAGWNQTETDWHNLLSMPVQTLLAYAIAFAVVIAIVHMIRSIAMR